jgi:hypothetical protein
LKPDRIFKRKGAKSAKKFDVFISLGEFQRTRAGLTGDYTAPDEM